MNAIRRASSYLLITFTALVLISCEGAEGRKDKYLEQAAESFAKKDWEKARIGYQNVLQIDPQDIQGSLGIAKTLEKLQDWRGAASRYRYVLEVEPENIEANLGLGKLLFAAQASDDALELAEKVLKKEPQNPSAMTLKAGVYSQQGKIDDAIEIAHKAYDAAEEKEDATIVLARLYTQKGRANKSINILQDELKRKPSQVPLQTILAGLYENTGDIYNAEKMFRQLVEEKPKVLTYRVALADFMERHGRTEEAESVIVDTIKAFPELAQAKISHSRLIRSRGDKEGAASLLRKYISENPAQTELNFELAQSFYAEGANEDAMATYQELLSKSDLSTPDTLKAKNRLALIHIKNDEIEKAEELLGEVLKENASDMEALKIRGGIALSREDSINAIADFRAVLGQDPSDTDIIKMLARAHLVNNEPELAQEQLKIVAQLKPRDTETNLTLAKIAGAQGNIEEAIQYYNKVYDANSGNDRVKLEFARLLMSDQRWDEAEVLVNDHIKKNPGDAKGYYFLGLAYQGQSKHDEAIEQFDLALKEMTTAVEPLNAKVKSLVASDRKAEAMGWLEKYTKENEKSVVAKNLLGELYLSEKQTKKATEEFEAALKISPQWWVPYRTLSVIRVSEGNQKGAIKILEKGIEEAATKEMLRTELARIHESMGNHDDAIEQYNELVEENEKELRHANNLAMLLVTYKDDQKSLDRAMELAEKIKSSPNPLYQDTAGWVHYKRGEYEQAMPIIRRVADKLPDSPVIQYHLAKTYYSMNDKVNAEVHLKNAVESEKKFPEYEDAMALLEKISKNEG